MPRIATINYQDSTGDLKNIYDDLIRKRGKLSEVLKIQSLHPVTISSHINLYMDIMFSHTALSRAEREMIAVVVSAANSCVYCHTHHATALQAYWKDAEKVEQLIRDYRQAGLSPKEIAMCHYAFQLTQHPAMHAEEDYTKSLQSAGLTDKAILDVALVTAYFNFVNRMVLGLGVELEADNGEGYKY